MGLPLRFRARPSLLRGRVGAPQRLPLSLGILLQGNHGKAGRLRQRHERRGARRGGRGGHERRTRESPFLRRARSGDRAAAREERPRQQAARDLREARCGRLKQACLNQMRCKKARPQRGRGGERRKPTLGAAVPVPVLMSPGSDTWGAAGQAAEPREP